MTQNVNTRFIERWERYFPGAELPVAFYYTDSEGDGELAPVTEESHCLICALGRVRKGRPTYFGLDQIGCGGGQRYVGFRQDNRPNFEYFLACGLRGHMTGIRFKKTPELVREHLKHQEAFKAPGKYIVFKRIDQLADGNRPLATIFFAAADVLAGLFTMANFDDPSPDGVICPSGSGCAATVYFPYREGLSRNPRAVLGMFDVSARPCVPANVLTLSVPWARFQRMVDNMDESFLITDQWREVMRRLPAK
jgi:hypothetical protein